MARYQEGNVELSDIYWDCECDEGEVGFGYIKSIDVVKCDRCGAYMTDCPPSRASEVIAAGLEP